MQQRSRPQSASAARSLRIPCLLDFDSLSRLRHGAATALKMILNPIQNICTSSTTYVRINVDLNLHVSRGPDHGKAMLKSVSPQLSPRGEQRIIRLTTDQEAVLQEQFNRSPRAPHTTDVVLLAAETGLSEEDVQGWYAIRLAQWRKEQGLGGNLGFNN